MFGGQYISFLGKGLILKDWPVLLRIKNVNANAYIIYISFLLI